MSCYEFGTFSDDWGTFDTQIGDGDDFRHFVSNGDGLRRLRGDEMELRQIALEL